MRSAIVWLHIRYETQNAPGTAHWARIASSFHFARRAISPYARYAGCSCIILDLMLPGRDGPLVLRGSLPQLEKNDNPPMSAPRPFSMPF
jgi:hypothetical protein